jgi:hypothetical protein
VNKARLIKSSKAALSVMFAERVVKDLCEGDSPGWPHENLLDKVAPFWVALIGETVVEFSDFLLGDLFVERDCLERSQASEQQGVEDDPETPDVDSLIVVDSLSLASSSGGYDILRDQHIISEVSWGAEARIAVLFPKF